MRLNTDRMIARKEGAIAWMIFNNPRRRNALSVEMLEAIPRILADFAEDDAVRVVVMAGAGERAFVSGADISEFEERRSSPQAIEKYDHITAQAAAAYAALGKPLIAMIRDACIGGGLLTAMRADLRVASDDAQFGVPAARLGLGYGFASVKALVDLVGPAHTREILLTGERFSAAHALRIGLINRVVPAADLEGAVRDLASAIADNAPLTIKLIRVAVDEALKESGERDYAVIDRLVADCFASDDYSEGRRAFLEKRTPVFRGR